MPVQALIALVAIIGVGLLPMPYGYYTLLKLAACGYFIWAAILQSERNLQGQMVVSAVAVIVYNPIIPVTLGSKGPWIVINLITIVYSIVAFLSLRETTNK